MKKISNLVKTLLESPLPRSLVDNPPEVSYILSRRLTTLFGDSSITMNRLTGLARVHIRGVMGSGKSTFATALSQATGIPARLEPLADYKSLEKAYADPARYREQAQWEIFERLLDHERQTGLVDTTLEDNVFVFSKHYFGLSALQERMEARYLRALDEGEITRPQLTIFLEPEPEIIHTRIRLRRRLMEARVTLADIQHMSSLLRIDREQHYRPDDCLVVADSLVGSELVARIESRLYAHFV